MRIRSQLVLTFLLLAVLPLADLRPGDEALLEGEVSDSGIGYGRRRKHAEGRAQGSDQ